MRTILIACLAGTDLTGPEEGEEVPLDELEITWEPATTTITGKDIELAGYQVIVEKDEDPHPRAFARRVFSVHLSPDATSVEVPDEFLEPGTDYHFEVPAVADNGNQTLVSSRFTTE